MAGIEHHGDWSNDEHSDTMIAADEASHSEFFGKNSFISRIDRKLATNPRLLDRLTTAFQRHQTPFYLYMFNHPDMSYFLEHLDYGRIENNRTMSFAARDPATITSLFGEKLIETFESRRKEGSIQIVLTHNEGGSTRHPLTPWIIAHRMAHGLLGTDPDRMATVNLMRGWFANVVRSHYVWRRPAGHISNHPTRDEQAFSGFEMAKRVCTFKSARENNILDDAPLELYAEMFTQYLMTGKIGRNPAPDEVKGFRGASFHLEKRNEAEDEIEGIFSDILERIENILEESQGHVFIC